MVHVDVGCGTVDGGSVVVVVDGIPVPVRNSEDDDDANGRGGGTGTTTTADDDENGDEEGASSEDEDDVMNNNTNMNNKNKTLHVAPMLDVSYAEFRQLVRIMSKRVVLWTEMVVRSIL